MPDAHVVMEGIVLGESPRWHDGRLWFADWVAREVLAVGPDGSDREVVLAMDSFPFSIDWRPDGTLLVVSAGDRRLAAVAADGSRTTVAELAGLADFPWNEIVVDGRGNAYVNSIGFDMMGGEAPRPGIIGLVTPDGVARQVADGVEFPNGMVVTPDNETLVVAESYANRLTAFTIAADGSLADRRVWADLGDGVPDGLSLDADGAIWYADVPNRRCVRVLEGGEVTHTVTVDRGCFACMLGGADRRTLFILAADWGGPAAIGDATTGQLLRAEAPAPAAGFPA